MDGTSFSAYAEGLARFSVRLLTWTLCFAIAAGIVVVLIWRGDVNWTVYNVPYAATSIALLLSALLALPAALMGVGNLARGEWEAGIRRIFYFLGALSVFFATELFSHYLVPCDWVIALDWGTPDWGVPLGGQSGGFACPRMMSAYGRANGIYERTHLLHHALLGGLPVLLFYRALLRRMEGARPAVPPAASA